MNTEKQMYHTLFSQERLDALFPPDRADQFFEALLGDAEDGAYDIRLTFDGHSNDRLHFNLELHQRPGKCLACNLTYGLPTVFSRHPVIDVPELVNRIDALMDGQGNCADWRLGDTRSVTRSCTLCPWSSTWNGNPAHRSQKMTPEPIEKIRHSHLPFQGGVDVVHATYVRHTFSRHFHEDYALGVIENGALGFRYRGENVVASPGMICLVIPGEVHDGHPALADGWTYRIFYLNQNLMRSAAGQLTGKPAGLPFFKPA